MINYKNILIGLFILLLTISPASAADYLNQITSVNQTLNLTIPEIISISTPPIIQFDNSFPQGFVNPYTNFFVKNQGNVNIDLFFQLQSNFINGNTILDLTQCTYTVQTYDKNNVQGIQRVLYGQDYLVKSWLQPNVPYPAGHSIMIPQTTAPGNYSATATYTAIKST